jgi:YhcH/YjgK/YiaL family protein
MIVDVAQRSHLYYAMNPRIRTAFEFIHRTDLPALATGKHAIDGNAVYALIQQYMTKPKEQGVWEAHRRFIDLQYVIQGIERIGYAPLERMTPGDYDPEKDFCQLSGEGDFLILSEGSFMILMPTDAHMPGIADDRSGPVKKMVIKIAI